jgi:putative toxin-antitoxin system antitoxin component (TIGR02293 family)
MKTMPEDNEKLDLEMDTFTKAVEIFGSKEEAELWLRRPAMALDGKRPVDLLRSPEGKSLVQELLGRLEHGVYI